MKDLLTGTVFISAAIGGFGIPAASADSPGPALIPVATESGPPLSGDHPVAITASHAALAWRIIAPSFEPPAEFAHEFDPFRSTVHPQVVGACSGGHLCLP